MHAFSLRKAKVKLKYIRSQLYRQLWRRPKSHFLQNFVFCLRITPKLAVPCKKHAKTNENCRCAVGRAHARPRMTHTTPSPTPPYRKAYAESTKSTVPHPHLGFRPLPKLPSSSTHRAEIRDIFILIVAADFAFL